MSSLEGSLGACPLEPLPVSSGGQGKELESPSCVLQAALQPEILGWVESSALVSRLYTRESV